MISASEAREKSEQIKKERSDEYKLNFPQLYREAKNKLETSIKVAMGNVRNETYIMLHNTDIADKLEKECTELGYIVKYSLKERTFKVQW